MQLKIVCQSSFCDSKQNELYTCAYVQAKYKLKEKLRVQSGVKFIIQRVGEDSIVKCEA